MLDIIDTLHQFLLPYFKQPIVIAYSGGVDSQVLLHACAMLKRQNKLSSSISVCHVNHGLSGNAEKWQQFTVAQCHKLSLPLVCLSVDIQKQPQQSLEAIAREKRYQAIADNIPDDAVLLTGHHQDDQLETFFLALKRGSGLKGLSGMLPISHFNEKRQLLARPLLNHSREDIVNFAKEHKLDWIEDESNDDQGFDRNFIRHQLTPLLKSRWQSFDKTLIRSMGHCLDAEQLILEIAEQDYNQCKIANDRLDIKALKSLSKTRFNHVIRYWFQQCGRLMPSQQQLLQLFKQLQANEDKTPEVKLGDAWLRRYREQLFLTADFEELSHWSYPVDLTRESLNELTIELPDSLGKLKFSSFEQELEPVNSKTQSFALPTGSKTLTISFVHQNPTCVPDYRQHSRPLKKIMQELAIPPWQRKRIPFLFVDDQLAAVIGHFVCKPFLADSDQRKINVHWLGAENSG